MNDHVSTEAVLVRLAVLLAVLCAPPVVQAGDLDPAAFQNPTEHFRPWVV